MTVETYPTDSEKNQFFLAPGQPSKLTDWEKEPDIFTLQQDLEAAKPAHDAFVRKVKKWRDLMNVEGEAKPPALRGRSKAQPRLVRRQAEWRYAPLSEPFNSSEKLFTVKPRTFEDKQAAIQNEIILNWQFDTQIDRVSFIDNYVRAAVDEGMAIVRLGWQRIVKKKTIQVPVWSYVTPADPGQAEQVMQQVLALKDSDPRGYKEIDPALQAAAEYFLETGMLVEAIQTGEQEAEIDEVVVNEPFLEVVDPENVYWDPSCGSNLDNAGFVIISFETSQAALRQEPERYKNLQYVDWEGAAIVGDTDHQPSSPDPNFNYKDTMRKRVVAYEYWGNYDIHGTGELVPIVATWIGNTLVRLEENPFPDRKHPLVAAAYMPNKRQVTGEPDAELLGDNQQILGAVTRGLIDLLGRSANAQQGFVKGALDYVNRRRYEEGKDYDFNPVHGVASPVIEHKYPEIPQSALIMLQMQNADAEALTGVKAFSGGLSSEAFGDVATGIKGILDAASKREMAILRRLAQGLVKIGKKIAMMNQEFLSEEEVVRVTNDEFVTVRREELKGQFDLSVEISTAEIDNSQAQDLGFILQTIGPNLDFGITKMILSDIAYLKRMPDLQKRIEAYEPQPDPLLEELKQLQIMKEKLEIEKLQSEIVLNHAKAKKELMIADHEELDIVEQETGTKHARDLEKSVAQSTGNQSLEITKALLKPRKEGESAPNIDAAVGFNELTRTLRDPRNQFAPPATPSNPFGNTRTF